MTEKPRETIFKIAICDDEPWASGQICALLKEHPRARELAVSTFQSCEDLCATLNSGRVFDLLFLDIEFPGRNGLEASAALRETLKDNLTQIVYVSSHASYAINLFQFRPLDFIQKPVTRERVFHALDRAMELMRGEEQYYAFNVYKELHRIPLREIRYFEEYHKQLSIHTIKQTYTCYSYNIKYIASMPEFMQIHKSYFVNINHVRAHRYDSLTLSDGTELSISRPYRGMVREAMLKRTMLLL